MTRALREAAKQMGFTQSSDNLTGSLLATLAASKPGGKFLELGTGVGVGSAWLLSGMDSSSTLVTVEQNAEQVELAQKQLKHDPRISFWAGDGLEYLRQPHDPFDLIFADTWPGKINHPELALNLVAPGGFYVVDDLELAWKEKREIDPPLDDYLLNIWEGQRCLIKFLQTRKDFLCTELRWSTGLMVCVKKGA